MRYLPHTKEDLTAMSAAVGIDCPTDLFDDIPPTCHRMAPLDLPRPLSEWELDAHMDGLASRVAGDPAWRIYMGAGSYRHYIPQSIRQLLLRSEFFTAYTPYQPEISQGTLQAIYEYQTYVTRLLGMDVANASMYDGASALAEALLMTIRITRKKKVAVSKAVHPLYRQVVRTYFRPTGYEVVELSFDADGRTDLSSIEKDADLAGVALQSPNFFGCVEKLEAAAAVVQAVPKRLLVTAFSEPLAYGLLKSPGACGADIACGEGQSFGNAPSFGGPGLGMFAARQAYVRSMPGRLVGKTVDREGRQGFVLTLATREQHIRRERATSNICSNQGLCATAAVMYMASLGGTGIRRLAALNRDRTEYLKKGLAEAGVEIPFASPTFNEFVARLPAGFGERHRELQEKRIVAGLPIGSWYPELEDHYLFCVTETVDRQDLDTLIREVTK